VTGLVYFTGTLYWITGVMVHYGDLETWVAVPVNAALVAFLALFPAVFALLTRRIVISHGRQAMIAAPLVWIATELGRTHLFGGFPWVLLGYSQTTVLPVAQLASLFGVYGVSMLVASVSTALAMTAGKQGRTPSTEKGYGPVFQLAAVLAIVIGVAVWGARRAASAEWTRAGEAIRIGLIQGNVDQSEKMEARRAGGSNAIFESYLSMTRRAIGEGAQFVIWPESAAPFRFEDDPVSAGRVRRLALEARVTILLGSDQLERDAAGLPTKYY